MIPYGRQTISDADIEAVVEVLRSDWLTQGPTVPRFEDAVRARVNAGHAVAANSATSALHMACAALGLGPGDWLWTVPNTFVASANCAIYCGAQVGFVDIDAETWNLSVTDLADRLVAARKASRLPKVVVPVHFSGQPTDQEAIFELGREFGFKVVEDASHSIGAQRNGEPVGSGRWSDVTVFSFHPVKIVTTGEGGMALCSDDDIAERLRSFRSHGITRDATRFERRSMHEDPAPYYYEQQSLGFNYRMTDIHAALGMSQLSRLDEFIKRRNELARRYDDLLASLPVQTPTVTQGNLSSFHLYVVCLDETRVSRSRRDVFEALRAAGIGVNVHYLPVNEQPFHANGAPDTPNASDYARRAITLPLFPTMTEGEQDTVVNALEACL